MDSKFQDQINKKRLILNIFKFVIIFLVILYGYKTLKNKKNENTKVTEDIKAENNFFQICYYLIFGISILVLIICFILKHFFSPRETVELEEIENEPSLIDLIIVVFVSILLGSLVGMIIGSIIDSFINLTKTNSTTFFTFLCGIIGAFLGGLLGIKLQEKVKPTLTSDQTTSELPKFNPTLTSDQTTFELPKFEKNFPDSNNFGYYKVDDFIAKKKFKILSCPGDGSCAIHALWKGKDKDENIRNLNKNEIKMFREILVEFIKLNKDVKYSNYTYEQYLLDYRREFEKGKGSKDPAISEKRFKETIQQQSLTLKEYIENIPTEENEKVNFDKYLENMKSGEGGVKSWLSDFELGLLALLFQVNIYIIQKTGDEYQVKQKFFFGTRNDEPQFLLHDGNHYQALSLIKK